MKSILTILFLFNTLISYSMVVDLKSELNNLQLLQINQSNNDSIDEKAVIQEVVEQFYVKGLRIRDFSLIRTVCIKEAKLYGVRKDSSLNITTLDQWSKNFNPDKPPFKTLEYEIKNIDYEGTAAQVKIRFVINEKMEIYDFLNLLKINGNWKIVNIIDY